MNAPWDKGNRAIAGVCEHGFRQGWGGTVPAYPSFRLFLPPRATCILNRPTERTGVLQVQLFVHIERSPFPTLKVDAADESWTWALSAGWQLHHHLVSEGADPLEIVFHCELGAEKPWFELRFTEISLFGQSDPRIRGSLVEAT